MKSKYKFLLSILTVIVCILFGCEKRESVSFAEFTAAETEPEAPENTPENAAEDEKEEAAGEAGKLPEDKATTEPVQDEILVVHICGAVSVPGVYELPAGSRIYQAVQAAGGFLEEADRDFLNQAQGLKDGCRVYVPTREETALAEDGQKSFISESMETATEDDNAAEGGLVNINTASKEELCTLPGIGEGKAESIISYRSQNGNFHTIDEIMKVEGIKEGLFRKVKDRITV